LGHTFHGGLDDRLVIKAIQKWEVRPVHQLVIVEEIRE
jgi:hypothetical protein